MGSNLTGHFRRKAIERENATARGVALGRARQRPSAHELAAFRAVKLDQEFWLGYHRGIHQHAELEQLALELKP